VDLTIVIPVFNEVESIGLLLDEISTEFDAETGYEIIVVDDGSSDGTPAVLQAARQSLSQLRTGSREAVDCDPGWRRPESPGRYPETVPVYGRDA